MSLMSGRFVILTFFPGAEIVGDPVGYFFPVEIPRNKLDNGVLSEMCNLFAVVTSSRNLS